MQNHFSPQGPCASAGDTLVRSEERSKDGASYRYCLTLRESDRVASFGLPLYSVSAEMTDKNSTTSVRLLDCFSDERHAFGFFDKIVDYLATPIDLPYILEDERKI